MSLGVHLWKPRSARLAKCACHARSHFARERVAFAPRRNVVRVTPQDGAPARRPELDAFFREPQHTISIRDRNQEVYGRRCDDVRDRLDGRSRHAFVDVREDSVGAGAGAVEECKSITRLEAPHAKMVRDVVIERDVANGQ
jgi:hypothetical protein